LAEQNFKNHTQIVPPFLINSIVLMLTFIGALVNLYQSLGDHERLYSAALLAILSLSVLVTTFFARIFPLKAQDRAIRAEENLRHFALTGKLLDARLKPLQIVALRFASDAEFPALAKQAADSDMAPKAIKEAVKNWRPDTYRV
jgi:hypothetical protein